MAPGFRAFAIFLLLSILAGCGAGTSTSSNGNGNVSVPPTTSTQHVVVVVLENQDYSSIIGNSQMPFFNSLATQNALATQFYSNAHPSIGNYFELTTGQNPTGDNDAWPGPFSGDNIARQLTAAGKTWKVYAESLPSVGYTGGDVYPYIQHHNPFTYFTDVLSSTTQQANIVPFSQFTTDLNNNALPNFSLVIPNDEHNGHDCPDGTQICLPATKLATTDSWLSANIGGLVQNTSFMNSGVLIVTLDESLTDLTNGGGRIPVVLAGSSIKTGFQSTNTYQFPSLLRFSLNTLGVTTVPGAGSNAASMGEFLK